jgi:hypothetical protein
MTVDNPHMDRRAGSDSKGLSRRQMIRSAAVAGAAAWTAPVIIDSLSSPAAAVTVGPCNYYVFLIRRDGASANCNIVNNAPVPPSGTGSCASTPGNNIGVCTSYVRQTSASTPVTITLTSCTVSSDTATVVFSTTSPGCQFQGQAQTTLCDAAPTLTAPTGTTTTTVTRTGFLQNQIFFVYLAIAC